MFNQPNQGALPNQPYMIQLDELINKQLHSSISPINFKLIGSSNGIVMDKLFPHKTMIYINALNGNDELIYQLIVVSLQFANPIVKKIPLVYSGQLIKMKVHKVSEISKVQIEMQQSPKQQVILSVKISISHKNAQQSDDTLSLLILAPEEMVEPSFKMLHLLKIKSADSHIYDFAWHPLSNLTIMVLTSMQNIQIWNLDEEDFYKPSHVIRVKCLKNNYNLSNQIKFRRFATVTQDLNLENQIKNKGRQNKLNFNKYALFIMNSNGDVMSVFPFLPIGSSITRQQYDFIYDTERDNSKQKIALSAYLNSCELNFKQQDSTYLISATPSLESHYQVQKWYKNGRIPKITQASKLARQQQFYNFKVFPLSEQCLLLVQVVHKTHASLNAICLSLINKQVQIDESVDVDNVIYQIAEIRNQNNNKQQDVRFITSDSKANQIGLSKFKALFYTEANSLFKLDLSSIFNFVQSNDLKYLQVQEPFPVSLIFSLGSYEFIASMAAEQSLNCFNFVRRSKNKAKFEIQPLGYVNAFSQIQNIAKASNQLIRKLNNLKVEPKNKTNTQQKDQKNQLQMNPQKLKQYQQKGIESVKKDYAKYSENIKNSIDQGMSKLKVNYEIMKKRLKQFNNFKQKRNLLNSLLEQIQQNNEQINSLLFEDNDPKQNSTGQLTQIQRNINTLNQLFSTARKKDLGINSEVQKTMSNDIDVLSERLKLVRQNLEQAKKLKKEIKNHQEE